ncbi:MAG: histidine phosphatase family protein [Actinobacteria bacterium]|nr:histidine phosphatase family protein [Actinomycetota bacterium]MDQ3532834.1 histidine phosphatase family protein [Actinomycetota bacterium]
MTDRLPTRGWKAAKKIAAYMKDKRFEPSIVLCSSALRARQTWDIAAPAFPKRTAVEIEPSLYQAGKEELMSRLCSIPPEASSVLLIGHNPAMQELVVTLASEGEQLQSIRKKFPTAALAVLQARISDWEELEPAATELTDFVTPKRLPP